MWFQTLLAGVSIGGAYALGGLGFVLVYKSTKLFNFAHGQLILAGAYLFFLFRVEQGLPTGLALVLCLLSAFALGVLIERLFLRFMVGKSAVSAIMLTVGLAELLGGAVGMIWGPTPYAPPQIFETEAVTLGGVLVAQTYVWTLGVTAVLIGAFAVFFHATPWGAAMRAVGFDQDHAALSGISVRRVVAVSWGIAAVLAAVAGVFIMQFTGVDLGIAHRGLSAFPAAVLGGMDSVAGIIIGGLIIGCVESVAGTFIDPLVDGGAKEVIGFVVLVIILMVRPYGLFGTVEIRKV